MLQAVDQAEPVPVSAPSATFSAVIMITGVGPVHVEVPVISVLGPGGQPSRFGLGLPIKGVC